MTSKRHITLAIVAVSALEVLAATLLWLDFDPQQVVPPCDDGDCEARNVGAFHFITGVPNLGAAQQANTDADSVEEVLEKGLALAEASPVHLAFRGSGAAGSVRCGWRGIAHPHCIQGHIPNPWGPRLCNLDVCRAFVLASLQPVGNFGRGAG